MGKFVYELNEHNTTFNGDFLPPKIITSPMRERPFSHDCTVARKGPTNREAAMLYKLIALSSSVCMASSTVPAWRGAEQTRRVQFCATVHVLVAGCWDVWVSFT